jgi:uncharacterized protein (DUF885 family)/outer membrane protein assembly factor BamB
MLPRHGPPSLRPPARSFFTFTFTFTFTLALACFTLSLPSTASPNLEALHALFQREWDRTLAENPTYASQLGDRRFHREWKDLDLNAFEQSHASDQQALDTLLALPRDLLPPAEQRNYDLFRIDLQDRLDAFPHRWWLIALDQREGFQTLDDLANSLSFDTLEDYQDWIARLRQLGRHADQTITLLREGIRQGRVQARVTMERVPSQIARHIVDSPEDSPFYLPLRRRFPSTIAPADQDRLRAEARTAITEVVTPAYARFLQFFESEYLPACRPEPGIHALPGGAALYALFARQFTTTALTPQEIHDLGLREVARIRDLMEQTRQEAGFSGPLEEYFHHLRTDPQYFHSSPLELLAAYQVVSKRIDPTLVRLFRTFPRTPYGVEPIPPAIAPDTTTAYYRPPAADGSRAGTYFVNLFRPETRPKWEMMALSLHEAVPGHHFQIALAQEQGDLPAFRRHAYYTAYLEGWALYAEALGHELGLYSTPQDRMGQLTYEMWRAVRLVVDTGIHAFGWDRDRAISYFRHHAPKAELDIVNEIDRYIAWPGQALAYKIGELKIKELRARAESALGPRFDLRDFHDVVLLPGARPLSLLESDVQEWINAQTSDSPSPSPSPTAAAALPWPEWRGPDAQGHATATGLPLEWSESHNIAWKTPIPGRGHSSPVIGNGRVWVTSAHESAATPEDAARRLASNTGDQPVNVLAEARFHAVGLDLASGRVVHDVELFKVQDPQWVHAQNSYASPTPVLAGHHLYAHFGSFGTAALDTRTGKVDWVWQGIQVMHENGPGSSPVVWNDLLLFHLDGSDSQQIVALHLSNGQLAWSTPRTGKMGDHPQVRKAYGTPLIRTFHNQPEALSVAADWLYSYDPATGRELWKLPYGGLGFSNVPRPVYGHGFIYVLTGFMRPEVLAVRYDGTAPAEIAWRYNRGVSLTPSPLLVGDELYFVSDAGGLLTCLNAHTGERHYQERLGGNFAASPTFADGRLYFHDREGVTTVIQPGPTFQVLARNTLDAPIQSSVAIAGQALFLRTQQAVYRIESHP